MGNTWSCEPYIMSASLDEIRKSYKEHEDELIWLGEEYYMYCLRLYNDKDFSVNWTLLHPVDYYVLRIRMGVPVLMEELYAYFIYKVLCYCKDSDEINNNLLLVEEIKELSSGMQQLGMKNELTFFADVESQAKEGVNYLVAIKNKIYTAVNVDELNLELFEKWELLYWDKYERYILQGESIFVYEQKCKAIMEEIHLHFHRK